MKRLRGRGNVLIEGAVSLFLGSLALAMQLDLIRRAHFEVLLHHGTFRFVRSRALGAHLGQSRRELGEFFRAGLGHSGGNALLRQLDLGEEETGGGLVARGHYRYPAFLRFPFRGNDKHHFEVTKRCLFPWSRY